MDTVLRMLWYLALIPMVIAAGICLWGLVNSILVLLRPRACDSREEAWGGLVWYGLVPAAFVGCYYGLKFVALSVAGAVGITPKQLSVGAMLIVIAGFSAIIIWRRRQRPQATASEPTATEAPQPSITNQDDGCS